MTKKRVVVLLLVLLNFIMFVQFNTVRVEASSAYYTYTLNRNNQLVPTNEAYEAVFAIRKLSDDSTLSGAKDLFIDSDDYLYIADTGNKRIVVLDPNLEVLFSFGQDVMIKPMGIHVVDDYIYVADYGQGVVNSDIGTIYKYFFDKVNNQVSLENSFSSPTSPILEAENFVFRPLKIAVDKSHTMYVVNEGTTSGVLMINENNRFIDYFASNSLNLSLMERLERIVFQNNENVYLKKNVPTPIFNIALDYSGYFYTITQDNNQDVSGNNIKKVNIGGINYFDERMYVLNDLVDAWPGHQENVYAVSSNGYLFEYDNQGNLLFSWGGKGVGNDKLGLFMSASSLAVDSKNNIYVLDDHGNRNAIHIFRETPFASKIHEALDLYNNAKYEESIEVWQEVLRYNSMLDIAYRGVGLGYMMSTEYEQALEQFRISNDKEQYSDAFWEIRNLRLIDNMDKIIYGILSILVLVIVIKQLNRKTEIFAFVGVTKNKIISNRVINEVLHMFYFLKNPADACYNVKTEKRSKVSSALIILGFLFIIYTVGLVYTGFVFNQVILEETILIKEIFKVLIPFIIFVFSNYLMSSLMEGEGTFKAIFINTTGALMPILIIYPFLILISNYLTLNEGFIYHFGLFIMILWSVILLYFNTKETHNFSVSQTFVNIFLSILFMVIIIIVLLIVYLMITQVSNFLIDIIKEVILRE